MRRARSLWGDAVGPFTVAGSARSLSLPNARSAPEGPPPPDRFSDTRELNGEKGEIQDVEATDIPPGEEGGIHQLAQVGQEAERRDPPDRDQPASIISEEKGGDRRQDGRIYGSHTPLWGDEVAPVLEQGRQHEGGHGYKGENANRAVAFPEGQDGDQNGEHRTDLLDKVAEHGPPP